MNGRGDPGQQLESGLDPFADVGLENAEDLLVPLDRRRQECGQTFGGEVIKNNALGDADFPGSAAHRVPKR